MDKKLTASGCRSKAKAFVLLPAILLLVVSVSGCTVPGLDFLCIPGLTCTGGTVEYENDVLVIKTLEATPQTISTGQSMRLSAWIENRGGETVPQKIEGTADTGVSIEIYDKCEGLFSSVIPNCPIDSTPTKNGCYLKTILPKQTVPISWTLVANDKDKIPLETSCNLKVYILYPYQTKSITSITFVDYVEMQRMINEGKFTPITSYITEGYGPVKPYLTVEDQQPIPVERKDYGTGKKPTTTLAFQVKNKGSGFLGRWEYTGNGEPTFSEPVIVKGSVKMESNTDYMREAIKTIETEINKNDIRLIGKESPKQPFTIISPYKNQIEKVATYYVTTSMSYKYEFRKEIKVTIKPPKIF